MKFRKSTRNRQPPSSDSCSESEVEESSSQAGTSSKRPRSSNHSQPGNEHSLQEFGPHHPYETQSITFDVSNFTNYLYTLDLRTGDRQSFESYSVEYSSRFIWLSEGNLLVTGGIVSLDKVIKIDIKNQRHEHLPRLNIGRFWHTLCIYKKKVWAISGRTKDRGIQAETNSVEVFDGKAWKMTSPLNIPRTCAKSFATHNRIFVFGGSTGLEPQDRIIAEIECWDGRSWKLLSYTLPYPAISFALAPLSEDTLLITGGFSNEADSEKSKSGWLLNIRSGDCEEIEGPKRWSYFPYVNEVVHEGHIFMLSKTHHLYQFNIETRKWRYYPIGNYTVNDSNY